jgi:hypothetical protein
MEGIFFSDSKLHYFKSKRAKIKFKNSLKKIFNDDNEKFVDNVNENKKKIIEKYMKKEKLINYSFNVSKTEGDNGAKLNVEMLIEENDTEVQKIKLKNKIENLKQERFKEQTLKNENKIKKKLKKDKRITSQMEFLYNQTKKEYKDIDDPKTILDNIEEYKEELEDYLEEVKITDYTPYAKYLMYNNLYTKYLSYMTNTKINIPKEIIRQKDELNKIVDRKVV